MRTLLFLTALLAAAPAMAGGHRSHDVDRTHATASRANRGGAQLDRNRSRGHHVDRSRSSRGSSHHARSNRGRGGPPPHARSPHNNVRRAAPGPRTNYRTPARTYQSRSHARYNPRRVDPWTRSYRGIQRSGFVWVDGCYRHGQWTPGYYRPVRTRPGYVWVHGYWNGFDYVDGYWRPAQRRGHVWVDGHYNGRSWVRGGWQVRVQGRRGGVVIYR